MLLIFAAFALAAATLLVASRNATDPLLRRDDFTLTQEEVEAELARRYSDG